MCNFVEIDVDFGYCGEVEMVLAHDEGGDHEDVEFYRDGLLAEDNAKLRELMRDTYDCICEMYAYMDGGYAYEDAEADPAYGPILKRMRELGVDG